MDFSIFAEPSTWATMLALIFLEIALGVDNLVFISITTDRLPPEKQHLGRKVGLAGALLMRILFLSFASALVHMTDPLFTIPLGGGIPISIRDLVLLIGGAYLVFKGIAELRGMLALEEIRAEHEGGEHALARIGLGRAVATIMAMDVVFSIDSVITAVGLADHLIIMIIAVMLAVFLMMVFIDQVSEFINSHPEIKMLALAFIVAIGALLIVEGLHFTSGIEVAGMGLEKFVVYVALAFALVIGLLQVAYKARLEKYMASLKQGGEPTGDVKEA